MDGAAALDYARERNAFADGDFARIRHQQQVINAILDKAASGGMLTNPGKLNSFLKATANAVAVDKELNLSDMATRPARPAQRQPDLRHQPHQGHRQGRHRERGLGRQPPRQAFYDAVRRDSVDEIVSLGKK